MIFSTFGPFSILRVSGNIFPDTTRASHSGWFWTLVRLSVRQAVSVRTWECGMAHSRGWGKENGLLGTVNELTAVNINNFFQGNKDGNLIQCYHITDGKTWKAPGFQCPIKLTELMLRFAGTVFKVDMSPAALGSGFNVKWHILG